MTHPFPVSVSLIILNWNGKAYLHRCLTSLSELDYPEPDIILVDNGSSDGSVGYVSTQFPTVRIIQNERNLGYAGGMNVGIAYATGDVVVLLNNDIIVEQDWLRELVSGLLSDERIGIAGCKIYYAAGDLLQHAGGTVSYPLGYTDHYGYRQEDDGSYDVQSDVPYVTGAAMAIRRSLLTDIGPLDADFYPIYYEDVDICYRAREAGWRVVYVPRSRLVHLESATMIRDSYQYLLHFHSGRLRFALKHMAVEAFLHGFVPAERERFRELALPRERRALARAYKVALRSLAAILGDRLGYSDSAFSRLQAVARALSDLHDQLVRPL